MKTRIKIIALCFGAGLVVWLALSVIGALLHPGALTAFPSPDYLSHVLFIFVAVVVMSLIVGLLTSRIIIQRENAAASLKESEERHRTLFTTMMQGIVYQNADGQIITANPAAERILGLTLDQMQGRTSTDPRWKAIHEDGSDFPGETHASMQALRTGKEVKNVVMGVFHPGTNKYVWININAVPLFKPGETKPYQVYTIFEDITERKQVEEALVQSEARFRAIFNAALDGILLADIETKKFSTGNKAICQMLGYSEEEIRNIRVTDIHPQEALPRVVEVFEAQSTGTTTLAFDIPMKRKDGSVFYADVNSTLVTLAGKTYLLGIFRDATERRKAEEDIARLARFPGENPNPILRVNSAGTVLYANRAASVLMAIWNIHIGDTLPAEWNARVKTVMGTRTQTVFEMEYKSRKYSLAFTPIAGESYINIYGRDITEQKRAEAALLASEARYRDLYENAPVMYLSVSADGKILMTNNQVLYTLGYPREELTGKPVFDLYADSPDGKDKARRLFQRFIAGESFSGEEVEMRAKDGRSVWISLSVEPQKDAAGRVIASRSTGRDITQRKKAEEAVRRERNRAQTYLDIAGVMIVAIDAGGTITLVNQRGCEILGYTAEEIIGKNWFTTFIPERMREEILSVSSRILAGEIEPLKQYENPVLTKDGTERIIAWNNVALRDEAGRITGHLSSGEDITERKQAEQHIKRLNSVLKALRDVNQLITREKDRLSLIQKSCDILVETRGYNAACIILLDENYQHTAVASAGNTPASISRLTEMMDDGLYPPCFFNVLHGQKATMSCDASMGRNCPLVSTSPEFGNVMGKMEFNGKVYGVIVLKPPIAWINDAEEQSLMEELLGDIGFALANIERMQQLEASEEKIREAEVFKQVDRLRSEFLANVSHELRTPLTSIKGYASTLLRQDVTWSEEERIDFIKIIEAETDRLTQFIGDLLDMSRLEAGAMPLEKEEHAVRDIIDTVKSRLETLAAKHRLVYIIPGDLPSVFADNMRIGQVFSNLVDNAVKHSPPQSEITLEARQSGEEIVFSVTDRGEGISSEHLEKIFDRFYQVRQRSRGHKAGTGLGLSICKGIVEQHGGRIWVESEVDKGSKFSFSMPVYKEELNA